jgi:hypothetical protein
MTFYHGRMTALGDAHRKAADCQRSLREKQGQLIMKEKRKGVSVWRLP